ncbi:MAG: hypothetical protein IJZ88_06865 [Clostridia bacterium]|nr:hypothetical protein [Clostridia bacterium]
MKKYNRCVTVDPFEQFSRTVYTTEQGLPSDRATSLAFDNNGVLYVGTSKGLSRFDDNGFAEVNLGEGEAEIGMLYCAKNNHLFVGAGNVLVEYNGKKVVNKEKFNADIKDMKVDEDGTTWLLTSTILYRKLKGAADYDLKIGVPGDGASLAVLRDNRVYVGTLGGGLHALAGKRWHWSELMADLTGLVSDYVTCVEYDAAGNVWVGTDKGVCVYDDKGYWLDSKSTLGLPSASITGMATDGEGNRYYATTTGLIYQHNGILSYYGYKRWLPNPHATDVAVSKDGKMICVATKSGLSIIEKKTMSLEEKAVYFRDKTEKYNIRKDGYCLMRNLADCGVLDENAGQIEISDNDGLWTGLYLAGLCYEYAVTKDEKVLELARRCLKAMFKLTTITEKEGFTARAIRYSDEPGFQQSDNIEEWTVVQDGAIEWLGETSSDEMTGHFYAYANYFDLCANDEEKKEIAEVVKKMIDHIIENDFHLVDIDGKPTTWANWNPDDLNSNHKWIYEKGTNSLEILSFLKTAEHITGDKKYAAVFDDLLSNYHYGMNVMQYRIPDNHVLHIDDQLCFTTVVPLLRYVEDPSVRSLITMGLTHHWKDERVEKNALFNVVYGSLTGESCDLEVIIDELVDFPLDTISWEVYNSHRDDLNWDLRPAELGMVPQLYEPLEPHERRLCYNDGNRFVCDCGCEDLLNIVEDMNPNSRPMYPGVGCSKGMDLYVPINYLHPYWMARYHGMIK